MSLFEFTLPDVGEGLDKGIIVSWQVDVGDTVKAHQILAEVETDKAIVEIPVPVDGTVITLGGEVGAAIAVGQMLAIFETVSETTVVPPPGNAEPTTPTDAGAASTPEGTDSNLIPDATSPDFSPPLLTSPLTRPQFPVASPAPGPEVASAVSSYPRVRASPATRKRARELGIDLAQITGTGRHRQVTQQDLDAHQTAAPTSPAVGSAEPGDAFGRHPAGTPLAVESRTDRVEPLSGLRRQIARNMTEAWQTVPHIFTFEQLDATDLVAARRAFNEELAGEELTGSGRRVSYLPFFVKACVAALRAHPRFNASLDMANERVIYHGSINIGIATATPAGLIVTVIHDADRKSLPAIAAEIESLAALARERRVTVDQIRGATFTISNYGSYGAWLGTPIVRPPEVAIAGFGRIHEAVVPVDGEPAVRTILPLAVSTDHRLNDGEHLGEFLKTMAGYLKQPIRLLAQG